jgi:type IV pilus assembly protein PilM
VRNTSRRSGGATKIVSVDIGGTSVRAVEMEIGAGENGAARILKRGSIPLGFNAWDDLATVTDSLAQAIRGALSAGGISTSTVVTALPRRLVAVKYAQVPPAEPEHIRDMVQYEAQQYIPFALEDVIIGHQIVSEPGEDMTNVLIVAARRSLVEQLLAAFDKAGLEVTNLSVSALGLAENASRTPTPTGLLDVEAGEMDIAVVSGGKLLFTRATALGESPDTPSGGSMLAGEVSRSLSAYQNEYRAQPVSQLLVSGSASARNGLVESLGGMLQVPVNRMNGQLLPAGDPEAPAFATAIGLALGAGEYAISEINLLPSSRSERKLAAKRRATTVFSLAAAIAIIGVIGFFLTRSIAAQQVERKKAEAANAKLTAMQTVVDRQQKTSDLIDNTYETVAVKLDHKHPAVDIVKVVSDAVPRGNIYLSQFSFERYGAVVLHGTAKNETAATDLVIALQASGAFVDVQLNYLGDAQGDGTAAGGGGAVRPPVRRAPPGPRRATAATPPGPGVTVTPGGATPALPGTATPAATTTPVSTTPTAPANDNTAAPKPSAAKPKPGENMSFIITCRLKSEPKPPPAKKPGAPTAPGAAAGNAAGAATTTPPAATGAATGN